MSSNIQTSLRKGIFLAGALLVGWAAFAQTEPANPKAAPAQGQTDKAYHGPRGGDGLRAHRFAHQGFRHNGIKYTPEQRKQAVAIRGEYRQKAADLFKKDNITLKDYKAGLLALQQERKSKLNALLTQEQKDQIQQHRKMAAENAQVKAAARMERLKLRLNLSTDQVAKLQSGQESFRADAKAIRENDNLLPQEKREQLHGLIAKRQETMKSVLTPDQLSKFNEMHKGHRQWRQGRSPRPGHSQEAAPGTGSEIAS